MVPALSSTHCIAGMYAAPITPTAQAAQIASSDVGVRMMAANGAKSDDEIGIPGTTKRMNDRVATTTKVAMIVIPGPPL
jgi:hypothetical protein